MGLQHCGVLDAAKENQLSDYAKTLRGQLTHHGARQARPLGCAVA